MRAFISYSRKNEGHLVRLKSHLYYLTPEQFIEDWTDNEIGAGKGIDNEIEQNIKEAKLILLLVSPDFINSPYCSKELEIAEECEKNNSTRVIPILVESCEGQTIPEFISKNKWLPKNGKPVSNWANEDVAWSEIVNELINIITDGVDPYQNTTQEIEAVFKKTRKKLNDASVAGPTLDLFDMTNRLALILNEKEEEITKEVKTLHKTLNKQNQLLAGIETIQDLKQGQNQIQNRVKSMQGKLKGQNQLQIGVENIQDAIENKQKQQLSGIESKQGTLKSGQDGLIANVTKLLTEQTEIKNELLKIGTFNKNKEEEDKELLKSHLLNVSKGFRKWKIWRIKVTKDFAMSKLQEYAKTKFITAKLKNFKVTWSESENKFEIDGEIVSADEV